MLPFLTFFRTDTAAEKFKIYSKHLNFLCFLWEKIYEKDWK